MADVFDAPKLTEYSKDEWFCVCRQLKPDLTPAEYEVMWQGFCEYMARREMH